MHPGPPEILGPQEVHPPPPEIHLGFLEVVEGVIHLDSLEVEVVGCSVELTIKMCSLRNHSNLLEYFCLCPWVISDHQMG